MKDVNWDAEKHVSPSGLEFDIGYLNHNIGKQCTKAADQALPTYDYGRENIDGKTQILTANKAEFISDCVKERRGQYEEWMTESKERAEAKAVLERINLDLLNTAKSGRDELVLKRLDTNQIPQSFEMVTDALKEKGYKIEVRQSQAEGTDSPPEYEVIAKFK